MALLKSAKDFNDHVVEGIYGKLRDLAMADLDPPVPPVLPAALPIAPAEVLAEPEVPVAPEVPAEVPAAPEERRLTLFWRDWNLSWDFWSDWNLWFG
ncbi:hypothetical protein SLE2022_223080 [Rubroshorea leprosula]